MSWQNKASVKKGDIAEETVHDFLENKHSKRGSLYYQFFQKVNAMTKYGESRHKYKSKGKRGLSGPTPWIVSKGTRKTYLNSGKRFTTWLQQQQDRPKTLDEIDINIVMRYFADKKDMSAYTLHTDRSAICKVLGFAAEDIPLASRRKADITRSRGKTSQAVRSAREAGNNPDLKNFLLATGLRRTEVAYLQVQDIDLDAGTVFVRRGKGGKSRIVPIRNDMLPCLRKIGLPADGKAFHEVSKNLDVHSHRREYAQAVFRELSGGYDYKDAKDKITRARLNKMCGEVAARLGHGRGRVWVVINHYLT